MTVEVVACVDVDVARVLLWAWMLSRVEGCRTQVRYKAAIAMRWGG